MLNHLQFFSHRPWRFLLKKNNKLTRFLDQKLWLVKFAIKAYLYIILTPLRYMNAFYYNIWVYGLWSLRDNLGAIINPKTGGMRYKKGCSYWLFWIIGLPFRMIKYGSAGFFQLLEGIIFLLIDTIFPAITMYHGTSKDASISISKPGQWLVGSGNYAGSGIYFTMDVKTAQHYAGSSPDAVIICARVTLGRLKNLSLTPPDVLSSIKKNGDFITKWGKEKQYNTVEWWRTDKQWWEYCLLHDRDGRFFKTWRIRILYLYNAQNNKKERIWGGKAHWIFR